MRITSSASAGVIVRTIRRLGTPALFTSTSTPPSSSVAVRAKSSSPSRSARSTAHILLSGACVAALARVPRRGGRSAARRCPRSRRRRANATAVAAPIPDDAPVTSTRCTTRRSPPRCRRAARPAQRSMWRMRWSCSSARRRLSDVGGALGPHVGERLLGVGQHQRPAPVVDHLHAVDELELLGADPLDRLAHHRALALPRRDDRVVHDVRVAAATPRPPRAGDRRPRAGRAASPAWWRRRRRGGSRARCSRRPTVPANTTPLAARGLHEVGAPHLGAHHRLRASRIRSIAPVTLTGHRHLAPGHRLADQRRDGEQELLTLEHVARVVDHRDELAVGIDHEPGVAARRPHQLGDALDLGRARYS